MMADDVDDFARRWPAAFMAAAVGARRFLAGRFLVSSAAALLGAERDAAGATPADRCYGPAGRQRPP